MRRPVRLCALGSRSNSFFFSGSNEFNTVWLFDPAKRVAKFLNRLQPVFGWSWVQKKPLPASTIMMDLGNVS